MAEAGGLTSGDEIVISHPLHGAAAGRLEELRTVEDLPEIPGWTPDQIIQVREIMREKGATHCGIISYHAITQQFAFAIMRINGSWFDLRGQELQLQKRDSYISPERPARPHKKT